MTEKLAFIVFAAFPVPTSILIIAGLVVAIVILFGAILLFRSPGKNKGANAEKSGGASGWQPQGQQQAMPGGWNQAGMGGSADNAWGQQQQPGACREETERRHRRNGQAVLDSDQLRVAVDIEILCRVHLKHIQVLINRFGLHIGLGTDLRRNLVPRRACNHHAHRLLSAALHPIGQLNLRRVPAREREWIKRPRSS